MDAEFVRMVEDGIGKIPELAGKWGWKGSRIFPEDGPSTRLNALYSIFRFYPYADAPKGRSSILGPF